MDARNEIVLKLGKMLSWQEEIAQILVSRFPAVLLGFVCRSSFADRGRGAKFLSSRSPAFGSGLGLGLVAICS